MTQREMFQDLTESTKRFGINLAYGEKVELDGTTIIPVAAVGFGAGAGSGAGEIGDKKNASGDKNTAQQLAGAAKSGQGDGAGFGGGAFPVGAYVSDEFGTRFQPNIIALLIAATPIALITSWGLPKLIKAIKR